MEDLLQSQIRDSCRLAIPEGLKDLMADISREVLRAQPQNLYQFIADYLSVLLVAREHLFVASRVCDDLCKDQCWRDLEDELRQLSLSEEDVKETLKVVAKYFSSDEVNEGNLLQKLTQKTNIEQKELPAVQDAIRCAFLRYRLGSTAPDESPSTDSELDETTIAAKHTLKIYQKATEDPNVNYDCVASKIQAAYRAFNVRRKREKPPIHSRKSNEKVRFIDKEEKLTADLYKKCASKCSSMSLAGSFVSLPKYHPYSVATEHHDQGEEDEVGEKERERINIDYVAVAAAREQLGVNDLEKKGSKKTISFHSLPKVVEVDYGEVEDEADEADYESEEIAEDVIDVRDERMINVSGNYLDEQQDNGNDLAKTDSLVISEIAGDESDLSENSLEENDDSRNLEQSEMDRITKVTVAQLAHDGQAHSLSIAQEIQDSMAVNTDESEQQYKGTSYEITPNDDMTLQLLRAVSEEIEEITKSQINE